MTVRCNTIEACTVAIAITLALATATAAFGIATKVARAETVPVVWMVFVTSGHSNTAQHLITAKYEAPTLAQAMKECKADLAQYLVGIKKDNLLTLVREPACFVEKPWSWVD